MKIMKDNSNKETLDGAVATSLNKSELIGTVL